MLKTALILILMIASLNDGPGFEAVTNGTLPLTASMPDFFSGGRSEMIESARPCSLALSLRLCWQYEGNKDSL